MHKNDCENFLEELKTHLENRYTENDDDYLETLNRERPNPPILKIIVDKRRSYYQRDDRRFRSDYSRGSNRQDYQSKQRYFNDNRHQNLSHPYRRDNNRGQGHRDGYRKHDQNYDRKRYSEEDRNRENEHQSHDSEDRSTHKRKL